MAAERTYNSFVHLAINELSDAALPESTTARTTNTFMIQNMVSSALKPQVRNEHGKKYLFVAKPDYSAVGLYHKNDNGHLLYTKFSLRDGNKYTPEFTCNLDTVNFVNNQPIPHTLWDSPESELHWNPQAATASATTNVTTPSEELVQSLIIAATKHINTLAYDNAIKLGFDGTLAQYITANFHNIKEHDILLPSPELQADGYSIDSLQNANNAKTKFHYLYDALQGTGHNQQQIAATFANIEKKRIAAQEVEEKNNLQAAIAASLGTAEHEMMAANVRLYKQKQHGTKRGRERHSATTPEVPYTDNIQNNPQLQEAIKETLQQTQNTEAEMLSEMVKRWKLDHYQTEEEKQPNTPTAINTIGDNPAPSQEQGDDDDVWSQGSEGWSDVGDWGEDTPENETKTTQLKKEVVPGDADVLTSRLATLSLVARNSSPVNNDLDHPRHQPHRRSSSPSQLTEANNSNWRERSRSSTPTSPTTVRQI